jgi:hypothetical protein
MGPVLRAATRVSMTGLGSTHTVYGHPGWSLWGKQKRKEKERRKGKKKKKSMNEISCGSRTKWSRSRP